MKNRSFFRVLLTLACLFGLISTHPLAQYVSNSPVQMGAGRTILTLAPTVSWINPTQGTNNGPLNVTITGANFLNSMSARLTKPNTPDIVATNVQAVSSTQLTCTFNLAGAAIGTRTVTVTHHANDGGQSGSLSGVFAVITPPVTVTSITPNSGTATGPVNVTISGSNFLNNMTARLTKPNNPDIVGTNVQTVSSTQLTCTFNLSGVALGPWTVTVALSANDGGQSASLPSGFQVANAVELKLSVEPSSPVDAKPGTVLTYVLRVKDSNGLAVGGASIKVLDSVQGIVVEVFSNAGTGEAQYKLHI